MWSNGRIFATQTKAGYEYWCKYCYLSPNLAVRISPTLTVLS